MVASSPIRSTSRDDLTSLGLRLTGAGGRFVLLFVLARELALAEVGEFGLVAATVGIAVYAVGLDYYTFTTRELVSRPTSAWPGMLREQGAVQLVAYVLAGLAALALWSSGVVPARLVIVTLVLTVLDHVSLELHRILLADARPVAANLVLALRSGAWGIAWAAGALFVPALRDLTAVYVAWMLGSAGAIAVGWWLLRARLAGSASADIDGARLRRGLAVAGGFLLSSLAARAMLTLDRYLLQGFQGAESVGVYTFYAGLANLVLLVVEAGALATRFPGVVAGFRTGAPDASERLAGMRRSTTRATVAATLVIAVLGRLLISLLDRPAYAENYPAFLLLLGGTAIATWSLVPHYALYGLDRDRPIIVSAVVGLLAMILAALVLVPTLGLTGAAIATAVGHTATAVVRLQAANRSLTAGGWR